jgi:hypothetical protein
VGQGCVARGDEPADEDDGDVSEISAAGARMPLLARNVARAVPGAATVASTGVAGGPIAAAAGLAGPAAAGIRFAAGSALNVTDGGAGRATLLPDTEDVIMRTQ